MSERTFLDELLDGLILSARTTVGVPKARQRIVDAVEERLALAADSAYARSTSTNMDIRAAIEYESECNRTPFGKQIAYALMAEPEREHVETDT